MRTVIKAHETADTKTDIKACLLKHMVTKNKAFHYKMKSFTCKHSLNLSPSITNKQNSVLHVLLTRIPGAKKAT